jgi:hypothetical protein
MHLAQHAVASLRRSNQLRRAQHPPLLQQRQHALELLAVKGVQVLQAPEADVVARVVQHGQLGRRGPAPEVAILVPQQRHDVGTRARRKGRAVLLRRCQGS